MSRKFECGVTASLLNSGAKLTTASNCAAIVGAAGVLLAHSAAARLIFAAPVLCWPAAGYWSVRVAVDASLFRELALADEESGRELDALLHRQGLARKRPERTTSDRSEGAIRIWKRLIAITGIQIATALAATIIEAWTR